MKLQIVYLSGRNLTTSKFIDRLPVAINRAQPIWPQLESKIEGRLASTAGICTDRVQYPGCQG